MTHSIHRVHRPKAMITTTEEPQPATLTTVTVSTIQPPLEVKDLRTLPQLEACVCNRAHEAVVDFARGLDLKTMTESHAVWLCPDGSVITEIITRKVWKLVPVEAGALLLELFSAQSHATPSSRLHRWVADPTGAFVGRAKNELGGRESLWDTLTSRHVPSLCETRENVWSALGWSRFRLDGLKPDEMLMELNSASYRRNLDQAVEHWLFCGKAAPLFTGLKMSSLRLGLSTKRRGFFRAFGGRHKFDVIFLQKHEEHLAEIVEETRGVTIK